MEYRSLRACVCKAESDVSVVQALRLHTEDIRQRTGGANAAFLPGQYGRLRRIRFRALAVDGNDAARIRNVGQVRKSLTVRIGEIESGGEVPADCPVPGADGGNLDAEALFEKEPDGGMVKDLGVHPSALAP